MDPSPYYGEDINYIDDKDLVDLPPLLPEDYSGEPKKASFNLSSQV